MQATLIDVAIPNNKNLCDKLRDLEIELKRLLKMEKIQKFSSIISTICAISKDLKDIKLFGFSEQLSKSMQKTVLITTTPSARRFMGDLTTLTNRPQYRWYKGKKGIRLWWNKPILIFWKGFQT